MNGATGTFPLRLAAVALLAATVVAVTGADAPAQALSLAAATCQGRPATIEGTGVVAGTDGDDVIVATGPGADVDARGGNDLVCIEDGRVVAGAGDDAVLGTSPTGFVQAGLFFGKDSYTGTGTSSVDVGPVTEVHVTLGAGGGEVWLYATSTPGTGSVDLGSGTGFLYALGEREGLVDLVQDTATVDHLHVTLAHTENVVATGVRARILGDDQPNTLATYGCKTLIEGGNGRDSLSSIGNGFDLDLPRCRHGRSVFRGGDGPDRMTGRNGDDVMLGGSGRDVAEGSGGNDRCVAEVRRHCER